MLLDTSTVFLCAMFYFSHNFRLVTLNASQGRKPQPTLTLDLFLNRGKEEKATLKTYTK